MTAAACLRPDGRLGEAAAWLLLMWQSHGLYNMRLYAIMSWRCRAMSLRQLHELMHAQPHVVHVLLCGA